MPSCARHRSKKKKKVKKDDKIHEKKRDEMCLFAMHITNDAKYKGQKKNSKLRWKKKEKAW